MTKLKETLDIIIRVAVIIILIEVIIMLIFVSILHRQPIVIEEEEIIWMSPCAKTIEPRADGTFQTTKYAERSLLIAQITNSPKPTKQSSRRFSIGLSVDEAHRHQEAKRDLGILRGKGAKPTASSMVV
jgi:hypothetical protein